MSAGVALQTALVAALRADAALSAEISGVFDGPPVRAAFPYVGVGGLVSSDFGHKTGRGREHRLAVTVWDDGGSAARVHRLMGAAESAIEAIGAIAGQRLMSLVFVRSRVLRDAAGPWAGIVEYRARTLEV